MWRLMCDSDQIGSLQPTDFITTYADLVTSQAHVAALEKRFPASTVLFIDRGLGDPLHIATIGDFEPRALTVAQAKGWVQGQQARGLEFITTYNNLAWEAAMQGALQGVSHYNWLADPGALTVPGHPAAIVQVLFAPPRGPHIDLSIVTNDAWHPAQSAGAWLNTLYTTLSQAEAFTGDAMAAVRQHMA